MKSRLSYANVMATIAVFIALGGASYAATQLPKNSVGTKQLKKSSVTAAKIKKGAVTGAKVDLTTLGVVPKASQADHASAADAAGTAGSVDGVSFVKFARAGQVPISGPAAALVDIGGLHLDYRCDVGDTDVLYLRATTSVAGAAIWLAHGTATDLKDPFNPGDAIALGPFVGTGVYTAPDGTVVTFTYRNTSSCANGVAGTAYGG